MTKEEVIKYLGTFDYQVIEGADNKLRFEREYIGRYSSTTLRVNIIVWFDSEDKECNLSNFIEEFHDHDIRLDDSLDVDDYSDLLRTICDEIREIENKFYEEVL